MKPEYTSKLSIKAFTKYYRHVYAFYVDHDIVHNNDVHLNLKNSDYLVHGYHNFDFDNDNDDV